MRRRNADLGSRGAPKLLRTGLGRVDAARGEDGQTAAWIRISLYAVSQLFVVPEEHLCDMARTELGEFHATQPKVMNALVVGEIVTDASNQDACGA